MERAGWRESSTQGLVVLMSPASGGPGGNPYVDRVAAEVRARSARVDDFTRRRLLRVPDVIHVHWPMSLIGPQASFATVLDILKVLGSTAYARWQGSVLVWTAHDLEPHEGFPSRLHAAFYASFLRQVDHVIMLSDRGASALAARWPTIAGRSSTTVPHGHYRDCYPPALPRAQARRILGVPQGRTVHLAFGQIRRYKDLVRLVQSWGEGRTEGEELHIVGEVKDAELEQDLVGTSRAVEGVHLHFGRADESSVSLWHSAADAVVLTYADGTTLNSGAAMLGLSFGLPVLVRRSATMQELAAVVGEEWLLQCWGPGDGLPLLRERLSRTPSRSGPAGFERFEWAAVGAGTVNAYRTAMGRGRPWSRRRTTGGAAVGRVADEARRRAEQESS